MDICHTNEKRRTETPKICSFLCAFCGKILKSEGRIKMTGKTHISCGFLIGTLAVNYYHPDIFTSITTVVLAVAGSMLPDICHTQSKIGRRFKILSWLVRILFGHRTFTHSLLFTLLIAILLKTIHTPEVYFTAFIGGMASHIILDMLTPRGVKLLYPLPLSVKLPIQFKTGGMVDLSLATAFTFGGTYVIFREVINQWLNQFITLPF